MLLLTKELEKRFEKVWSQEEVKDPIVITKFFHPMSDRTRYATEYNPEDKIFFWFVDWLEWERWYFSLQELNSVNIHWLPMERDKFWDEKPFSKIKTK